jgi:hypothetical protein
MKGFLTTTCYFTAAERRALAQIAQATGRSRWKVVQFAVRVFEKIYREDPQRALELARQAAQEKPL